MVVLILAACLAIAAPFALSMFLYEKSAAHFRDSVRARLAAEGAIAHAVAILRRTEDEAEKSGRYPPPWNTPDCDTAEEFSVGFGFADKVANSISKLGVGFDDPRGVVWSVRIEDEQGKVNLLSAPPCMIGTLLGSATLTADLAPGGEEIAVDAAYGFYSDDDPRTVDGRIRIGEEEIAYANVTDSAVEGLVRDLDGTGARPHRAGSLAYDAAAHSATTYQETNAPRAGDFRTLSEMKRFLRAQDFERIEPYVTVHSNRESGTGWFRREEIAGGFGPDTRTFPVREVSGFGPGTRVRFLVDGVVRGSFHRVVAAHPSGQGGTFVIERPIGWDRPSNVTVDVEAEQRHPINVNTAPQAVLAACFAGVGFEVRKSVTRLQAEALAGFVHRYVRRSRPMASAGDLKAMFEAAGAQGALGADAGRKVEALVENATVANSPNLALSTTTFCFKSFGNFTIEGAGIVATRAGKESARFMLRQQITLPVSSGGRWVLSSQKDFDGQIGRQGAWKVVTWPFREPPTGPEHIARYTQGLSPGRRRTGDPDPYGDVRLATGRCAAPTGRPAFVEHFDGKGRVLGGNYEITHDGAITRGGALQLEGSRIFAASPRGDLEPVLLEAWSRPAGVSGSVGLFSAGQPDRNGIAFYYNARGRFGPEFTLRVADACARQGGANAGWTGPAEFRFPATPLVADNWYHVAVQAKGSGANDAWVSVDGVPIAEGVEYRPSTTLAGDLGVPRDENDWEDASVMVLDNSDFPNKGAILVDGEVIEYGEKVRGGFGKCRRGRRTSRAPQGAETWRHSGGALVVPYGYSVPLVDRLFPGNAVVKSTLGGGSTSLLPAAGGTLGENDATIPVVDASGFQDSGYICISFGGNFEFVYYKSKSRTEFRQCDRHQFSGNRTVFDLSGYEFPRDRNVQVRQASIAATGLAEYPAADTRGDGLDSQYACIKVQDDNDVKHVEWVRVEHKETRDGTDFILGWTAYQNGNRWQEAPRRDVSQIRGALGTRQFPEIPLAEIPDGAAILPVVRVGGPQCGDQGSGHSLEGFEYVTPADGGNSEDALRFITCAHAFEAAVPTPPPHGPFPYTHYFAYRISLDDYVTRTYAAGTGRILKFPSGEMPRGIPAQLNVGSAPGAGTLNGWLDEVKGGSGGARAGVVAYASAPVEATDTEIRVAGDFLTDGGLAPTNPGARVPAPGLLNRQGMARIDDELLYFGSAGGVADQPIAWGRSREDATDMCPRQPDSTRDCCHGGCRRRMEVLTLGECVRGILGTRAARHAPGARVLIAEGLPLTRIESALPPGGDSFSVRNDAGMPDEGYAVIFQTDRMPWTSEIVGWTRKKGATLSGAKHFRGRYGTSEKDHRQGDLALNLPFRYWSRYARDYDSSDLAFFQGSHAAPGAQWYSIDWGEAGFDGGAASDRQRLRVLCRFDGSPDWDAPPSNRDGGLWEFHGPGPHDFRTVKGPLVADSIEVRVFWEHLPGAWGDGVNDWKRTLRLKNLIVEYGNPMVVRKVDLLDY